MIRFVLKNIKKTLVEKCLKTHKLTLKAKKQQLRTKKYSQTCDSA